MKIAIHSRKGSFSDLWIIYCEENKIPYKTVNCYDSDIISQLIDCIGLMWHWDLNDHKAVLFARQLTLSLEKKGIKVFPDVNTSWHYDDKVGQKYLLESVGAPLVKSHVFYSKNDALKWIAQATFPLVFKLRVGAASVNVCLVKSKQKAKYFVRKAFGSGFSYRNQTNHVNDKINMLKRDKNIASLIILIKSLALIFISNELKRFSHKEKGYIYFQDFVSGNNYDTRLVVIGDRCFGARRYCRDGDFRASGSGFSDFDPSLIDLECIKIAFEIASKLKSQSLAFDFIKDKGDNKIVEISYCFPPEIASAGCKGYWDKNILWHNKTVNPQYFMIEDFVDSLKK